MQGVVNGHLATWFVLLADSSETLSAVTWHRLGLPCGVQQRANRRYGSSLVVAAEPLNPGDPAGVGPHAAMQMAAAKRASLGANGARLLVQ